MLLQMLTLIHESWKKNQNANLTLRYLMMLISNGICQHERKYAVLNKNICHFLGQRDLRKKSKARKHIQIDPMLRSGFFSAKHAR